LDQLEISGATQYTGRMFTVTYVKPTTRVSLDSKRLQEELPEIYASYIKETQVKASVKLNEIKD
jgi:predicted phage-related endonuclease